MIQDPPWEYHSHHFCALIFLSHFISSDVKFALLLSIENLWTFVVGIGQSERAKRLCFLCVFWCHFCISNTFLRFSIKENSLIIHLMEIKLNQFEFSATHFINANDSYQGKDDNLVKGLFTFWSEINPTNLGNSQT